MSQHAAVLFANDAFYLAFSERDFPAMDALWARRAPVTCIHPGWSLLSGRRAVMESWRGIFSNPNAPEIRCRDAEAHPTGDLGYVLCYEELEGGFLLATNVFLREEGTWRMVHHQAGPTQGTPGEEEGEGTERVQ